jgi:hypothetical protein
MDLIAAFQEGQQQFWNILRELIFRNHPEVFEQLDFYEDAHFSDPLLFGYFNQLKGMSIQQIQQVFLSGDNEEVWTDEFGVAFLPQIGYFKTGAPTQRYTYRASDQQVVDAYGNGYSARPIIRLDEYGGIEVCLHTNPFYTYFLIENGAEPMDEHVRTIETCLDTYIPHIKEAFEIIRKYNPEEYQLYTESTRRIILHEREIRSFVTRQVHGTIFISVGKHSNTPFFLEEIIHQCSHNVFNAITADVKEYLKVEPEAPMSELTGEKRDIRDLFGAFHGVYTVSTGVNTILPMILQDDFPKDMYVEMLGRLAVKKPRWRTGVQNLNFDEVFTEKGKALYHLLDDRCQSQLEQHPEVFEVFDFTNQPSVFSFEKFLEANPMALDHAGA